MIVNMTPIVFKGPLDRTEPGTCSAENSIALSIKLVTKQQPIDLEDYAEKSCQGEKEDKDCESGDEGCGKKATGTCCSTKMKPSDVTVCYSCRWLLGEIVNK